MVRVGESASFYCLKCKVKRNASVSKVTKMKRGTLLLRGVCGKCGTKLATFKSANATAAPAVRKVVKRKPVVKRATVVKRKVVKRKVVKRKVVAKRR